MNNDYTVGWMSRDRQAGFTREAGRDELVAKVHDTGTQKDEAASARRRGFGVSGIIHGWRAVRTHLAASRLRLHGIGS